MIEELTAGMNIYYRGYVIHEDIRSICYTIYDRRPGRVELTVVGSSQEAMEWVDCRISIEARLGDSQVSLQELLSLARASVVA